MNSLPSGTFAERLKDLRKDKKLTFADAAKRIGIKQSSLHSYENTDEITAKSPGMKSLIKLARFYGVSVDYLCCLTEARNPSNASGVDGLGLSEEVIERLENWKFERDINSAKPRFGRDDYAETVLWFIDELLCSVHIEEIAKNAKYFHQCLSGSIESLQFLIDHPERISTDTDPETGNIDDDLIKANIDNMLLYEYKAKDRLGDFIERLSVYSKSDLWELQAKFEKLRTPTALQSMTAGKEKTSRGNPREA